MQIDKACRRDSKINRRRNGHRNNNNDVTQKLRKKNRDLYIRRQREVKENETGID